MGRYRDRVNHVFKKIEHRERITPEEGNIAKNYKYNTSFGERDPRRHLGGGNRSQFNREFDEETHVNTRYKKQKTNASRKPATKKPVRKVAVKKKIVRRCKK